MGVHISASPIHCVSHYHDVDEPVQLHLHNSVVEGFIFCYYFPASINLVSGAINQNQGGEDFLCVGGSCLTVSIAYTRCDWTEDSEFIKFNNHPIVCGYREIVNAPTPHPHLLLTCSTTAPSVSNSELE